MNEKSLTQKSLQNFLGKDDEKIQYLDIKKEQNRKKKTIVDVPKPFLKWVGGKRQLILQMNDYFPKEFNKYIEPFVGGGAIFFYLLPETAILIDVNKELINTYNIIKNNVSELIKSLKNHKNEKDYYYEVRSKDRNPEEYNKLSDVNKASRTIYLNRCCFNGLYRVNSKGQFNVPFGTYRNPKFCDEENLVSIHKALKNVLLINDSFEKCLDFAEKDDFIYFDPPYVPISRSANFTSYTKGDFGKEDQIRLFDVYKNLDERGCKVMLSNSYSDFILDLYKEYQINILYAKRAINSDGSKRGKIKEVLITNSF
ncbi:Modification methylase DpnIIA [subsurface metagenome]